MPTLYRRLSQHDRDSIYRLRKLGKNQNEIAEIIGFHPSTVSREISRNSGEKGYRPKQAGLLAATRKLRQRRRKKIAGEIERQVRDRLLLFHSPEQISGAMKKEKVDAPSYEAIYQFIASDKKAGGGLFRNLRINGKRRYRRRSKLSRSKIPNRVGIEERAASVENRLYYGDWEADLVEGTKGTGYILTLVERKSRYTIFRKLTEKSKELVSLIIIESLSGMKVRSITYDNGLEFANHETVSQALGAKAYFCNPYHPWEKPVVENHNGLLRQYFEKGSAFDYVGPTLLQMVQDQINQRPRKTLDYRTPEHYQKKLIAA